MSRSSRPPTLGPPTAAGPKPKARITPEGFAKLKQEAEHLWRVERPQVTAEVEAAAALGDRSENAEYQYGKRRLREIDRRLRWLSKRMDNLEVVRPGGATRGGKAGFGAWVSAEDEDGNELHYRLVGADEADPAQGTISVESPVGRALLGREVDDDVTIDRPRGPLTLTIIALSETDPRER
jgi:transcription elongation factor GreB